MKIIIQTCDRYKNILEAHKYTYEKFFKEKQRFEVIVLGYSKPDFDLGDWKFVSMGEDRGPQNFTDDIRSFFNSIEDDFFIFANDDIVYVDEPDLVVLDKIIEEVKELKNFGRISLAYPKATKDSKLLKSFDDWDIYDIGQDAEYRLSLQYSLWKTDYFKKYISPGLNPWQWELRDDAKNDGQLVLVTSGRRVIKFGHIMKKCKIIKDWYCDVYGGPCLDKEDVLEIKKIFKKHSIKDGHIQFDKLTRNFVKFNAA